MPLKYESYNYVPPPGLLARADDVIE